MSARSKEVRLAPFLIHILAASADSIIVEIIPGTCQRSTTASISAFIAALKKILSTQPNLIVLTTLDADSILQRLNSCEGIVTGTISLIVDFV